MTSELSDPPELRRNAPEPEGVLQKNLKVFLYLAAGLLVIVAAVFSSVGKKATNGKPSSAKDAPPQPMVQDNTDNNIQDLKNQLAAERLKEQQQAASPTPNTADPALANATPAQQAAAAPYGPNGQPMPCMPGQPCQQQYAAQAQLSPAQQQTQQLAAKERELAYDSRFASNLAYVHQESAPVQHNKPMALRSRQLRTSSTLRRRRPVTSLRRALQEINLHNLAIRYRQSATRKSILIPSLVSRMSSTRA